MIVHGVTSRQPLRILVVDDQAIIRRAIRALLATKVGLQVVGEAASGEAAVPLVERLRPDVVLMDLVMPGMGGVEAIRRIVQRDHRTRILVLTSFASDGDLRPALAAGAAGCLSKESGPLDLIRAIRQVSGGRTVIDPQIVPNTRHQILESQVGGVR